jgi:hypothetical protein
MTGVPLDLLSLSDVEAARELLTGVVETTPVLHSRPLSEVTGVPTWLKCENQQRAGLLVSPTLSASVASWPPAPAIMRRA